MWTTCFLLCGKYHKLPTPWGSNCSSSKIIDWQFAHLSRFLTNGISLCSGEAEMKKLQRSRQAHFLGAPSPDSFPPDRFARRSRVTQRCACPPGWYQVGVNWKVTWRVIHFRGKSVQVCMLLNHDVRVKFFDSNGVTMDVEAVEMD